jgi:beta-glucanase (GH16 family)
LQSEDMQDHVRSVIEKSAKKLVGQSISNGWIHSSNEYLQTVKGPQMGSFCDGSDTYLAEE